MPCKNFIPGELRLFAVVLLVLSISLSCAGNSACDFSSSDSPLPRFSCLFKSSLARYSLLTASLRFRTRHLGHIEASSRTLRSSGRRPHTTDTSPKNIDQLTPTNIDCTHTVKAYSLEHERTSSTV